MNHTLNIGNDSENYYQNSTSLCLSLDIDLIRECHFWIKGVSLFCVAIIGLFLNLIAVHILATRNSMKNTFNNLLISLFCFDSVYLLLQVISGIQSQLEGMGGNYDIITILVPNLLFPMSSVTLTASILMTVGIAHERYIAIKKPIQHRQSMRSSSVRRNRLFKYIAFVIICAFAINVTKFMETEVVWKNASVTSGNETEINR